MKTKSLITESLKSWGVKLSRDKTHRTKRISIN